MVAPLEMRALLESILLCLTEQKWEGCEFCCPSSCLCLSIDCFLTEVALLVPDASFRKMQ